MALFERPTLKALFSMLVDGVLGTSEPEKKGEPDAPRERRARPEPARVPSALLRDPAFAGIGASHEPDGFLLSWRTTREQLEDAARVGSGVPSLRLVLVRAAGEAEVAVDTLDLGEVPREGARLLPEVPDVLSAVASIGLFDGAKFVSVAHATVV
jgi:hypothetical protein